MEIKATENDRLPSARNNAARGEARTYSGTGYLMLLVRTADGAVPLESVRITLRDVNGRPDVNAVGTYTTDRSGATPRIELPAPPRSLSVVPGNPHPYAVYGAEAAREGYYTNTYGDIPVFDGITSIQTVIMIPLPEGVETDPPPADEASHPGPSDLDVPNGGLG